MSIAAAVELGAQAPGLAGVKVLGDEVLTHHSRGREKPFKAEPHSASSLNLGGVASRSPEKGLSS